MKYYSVMDMTKGKGTLEEFIPINTPDFAEFLRSGKEYALSCLPKKEAEIIAKLLPSLESGVIKHIEVNQLNYAWVEVEE